MHFRKISQIALVLLFVGVHASESIEVRAVDDTGHHIKGAQVEVQTMGRTELHKLENDGRTKLEVEEGSRLFVSAPGYFSIEIFPGEIRDGLLIAELRKKPKPEEVVVRAQRISRDFAPTYIDHLESLANGSARGDALISVSTLQYASSEGETAHLELRGSPDGSSRLYIDEVPIYDAVHRTNLSRTAPGTSLLGSHFYSGIEVYPSNPPAYLSNVSTGAVRLAPPVYQGDMSTLVLMSSALTFINSKGLNDDGTSFSHVFGERQDLSLATALNPDLNNTIGSYAGNKFGGILSLSTDFNSRVSLKWLVDRSTGEYPINVLSRDTNVEISRRQKLGILSYEGVIGNTIVRANWGENRSHSSSILDTFVTNTDNRFSFRSIGFDTELIDAKVQLRGGVVSEIIDLQQTGDLEEYSTLIPEFMAPFENETPSEVRYTNSHLYSVFKLRSNIALQIGVRTPPSNWADAKSTYQSSITFSDSKNTHQTTISGGRYFAIDVPEPGANTNLINRVVEQLSVDFRIKRSENLNLIVGIYTKTENAKNAKSEVYGIDTSIAIQPWERTRFTFRYTSAEVNSTDGIQEYPESHSLDYLWGVTSDLGVGFGQLSISYLSRSGRYFTPIKDTFEFRGQKYPIPSSFVNQSQLGDFRRLDASYGGLIRLSDNLRPLLFVGISNILNRQNERSPAYYDDFSRSGRLHYSGRTLTCGLVFMW